MDEENRRKDLFETRKELTGFLKKEKRKGKLFLDAKKRAEDVLKDIVREISTS